MKRTIQEEQLHGHEYNGVTFMVYSMSIDKSGHRRDWAYSIRLGKWRRQRPYGFELRSDAIADAQRRIDRYQRRRAAELEGA